MTKLREDTYREALLLIRDSTFRNALQLRAVAQRALEAAEPIPYAPTEAGLKALRGDS
jgi:hypothetical protein